MLHCLDNVIATVVAPVSSGKEREEKGNKPVIGILLRTEVLQTVIKARGPFVCGFKFPVRLGLGERTTELCARCRGALKKLDNLGTGA